MRIHGPNHCLIVFQRNLNGLNGMCNEAAQFAQNRMMCSSSSALVTSDLWYSQPKPWQDNKCSSIIPHPRLSDEPLCDICNLSVTKEPCQRSPGICPGIARNKWIPWIPESIFIVHDVLSSCENGKPIHASHVNVKLKLWNHGTEIIQYNT